MPDPVLERFQLAFHPYALKARNCLERNADHAAVMRLTCFTELHTVPKVIRAGIAEGRPRFFLVSGSSGSGRTSIANCILDEYRRLLRPDEKGRLALPKLHRGPKQTLEMDPTVVLRRWLDGVLEEADDRQIRIDDDLQKDLQVVKTPTEEQRAYPDLWASDSARLVKKLLVRLKTNDLGAAIVVDGVTNGALLAATAKLLHHSPVICVFTTSPDGADGAKTAFELLDERERVHLQLSDLNGNNAVFVAKELWASSSEVPWPLSEDDVNTTFTWQPAPIGRVLAVLAKMLAEKAAL